MQRVRRVRRRFVQRANARGVLAETNRSEEFFASFLHPDDRSRRAETRRAEKQRTAFERIEEFERFGQPDRPGRKTRGGDDHRVFDLFQQFVVQLLRLEIVFHVHRVKKRMRFDVQRGERMETFEKLKDRFQFADLRRVVREKRDVRRGTFLLSMFGAFLRVNDPENPDLQRFLSNKEENYV